MESRLLIKSFNPPVREKVVNGAFVAAEIVAAVGSLAVGALLPPLLVVGAPIALLAAMRALVDVRGVTVDTEADLLRFPGGGVEANGMRDYVSPRFLLQGLAMREVRLSEIRSVRWLSVRREGGDARRQKRRYAAVVTGAFGVVNIPFCSRGKMDQFCSAVAALNRMGVPVVAPLPGRDS